MAGSLTQTLVETNLKLTEQIVALATAVIENRPVTHAAEVAIPALPSFDEFAKQETPEERLFYSEEEEDQEFADSITGDSAGDPQLTKKLLEAAGHHELAATVTAT